MTGSRRLDPVLADYLAVSGVPTPSNSCMRRALNARSHRLLYVAYVDLVATCSRFLGAISTAEKLE